MRGHDRQEDGPLQRCQPASGEGFGVQPDRVVDGGPGHVQVQRARLMNGQLVQQLGDLRGDPGPHQHVVHTGEHRPVCRTRRGHLDLLQEVDPDQAVMTLLGQPHLGEVGHDRQLQVGCARTHGSAWGRGRTADRGFCHLHGSTGAALAALSPAPGTPPGRAAYGHPRRHPATVGRSRRPVRSPRPRRAGQAATPPAPPATRTQPHPCRPG